MAGAIYLSSAAFPARPRRGPDIPSSPSSSSTAPGNAAGHRQRSARGPGERATGGGHARSAPNSSRTLPRAPLSETSGLATLGSLALIVALDRGGNGAQAGGRARRQWLCCSASRIPDQSPPAALRAHRARAVHRRGVLLGEAGPPRHRPARAADLGHAWATSGPRIRRRPRLLTRVGSASVSRLPSCAWKSRGWGCTAGVAVAGHGTGRRRDQRGRTGRGPRGADDRHAAHRCRGFHLLFCADQSMLRCYGRGGAIASSAGRIRCRNGDDSAYYSGRRGALPRGARSTRTLSEASCPAPPRWRTGRTCERVDRRLELHAPACSSIGNRSVVGGSASSGELTVTTRPSGQLPSCVGKTSYLSSIPSPCHSAVMRAAAAGSAAAPPAPPPRAPPRGRCPPA